MKYLLILAVSVAVGQEFETVGSSYTRVARDVEGNYYVLETTDRTDLPVSTGAAQIAPGGGMCATTGRLIQVIPCQDVYLRKLASDGRTLLAATYLGGTSQEFGGLIAVGVDGNVFVTLISTSGNFAGGYQAWPGNPSVIVKLDPGLKQILAARRFSENVGIAALIVDGSRVFAGGTNFKDSQNYEVFVEELGRDLATLRGRRFVVEIGGGLYAMARQRNGNLILAWGRLGLAAQIMAVDLEAGIVKWQRPLEEHTDVKAVGILKADGLAVFGNVLIEGKSQGFVQRFGGGGEVVEKAQKIGSRLEYGWVVNGDTMRWVGKADRGLLTSELAPVRCRPFEGADYFGEMRQEEGSPSFVSYFRSYGSGISGEFAGAPLMRQERNLVVAALPVPVVEALGACLEKEVESYSVTLGRSPSQNFNQALQQSVAPGEFLTLYGSGISSGSFVVRPEETGSLPDEIGGTRVLVDGIPAGIIAIGPNTVTIAMPYEISGRENVQVLLERDGRTSEAIQLRVIASKPAILSQLMPGYDFAGVYINGELSTPERLVSAGDEVSVYLVGAGQLNEFQNANSVIPEGRLPKVAGEVTAFIEGSGGQVVLFAGGVKGQLPGLTQVNVKIGSDLIFYGRLSLRISINGQSTGTSFWVKKP